MGFGAEMPERSSPMVRTQSDLAQEKKDDYTKRWRARQRTLLSQPEVRAEVPAATPPKTRLGE